MFSHHSLGICPWVTVVTVGRGYRISPASNPHGLSYTNVFFPLLEFSCKLLLCLLPGNPCKFSSQMPLCVPAMAHCWKTLFTYSCGKKIPIHLFFCFFQLTTILFHVQSSTVPIILHNPFPQSLLLASNPAFYSLSQHPAGCSRRPRHRSRSAPPPPAPANPHRARCRGEGCPKPANFWFCLTKFPAIIIKRLTSPLLNGKTP